MPSCFPVGVRRERNRHFFAVITETALSPPVGPGAGLCSSAQTTRPLLSTKTLTVTIAWKSAWRSSGSSCGCGLYTARSNNSSGVTDLKLIYLEQVRAVVGVDSPAAGSLCFATAKTHASKIPTIHLFECSLLLTRIVLGFLLRSTNVVIDTRLVVLPRFQVSPEVPENNMPSGSESRTSSRSGELQPDARRSRTRPDDSQDAP